MFDSPDLEQSVDIIMTQAEEEKLPTPVKSKTKRKKETTKDPNRACVSLLKPSKSSKKMKCPPIKGLSLNCKGLSDPLRSLVPKQWMISSNIFPDFICLQELKAAGGILNANLMRLGAGFQWFVTNHHQGRGGVALAIAAKYSNLVR